MRQLPSPCEVTCGFSCCSQVPVAVSHSEFWQRYFYKVHRLEQVGQEADGQPSQVAL